MNKLNDTSFAVKMTNAKDFQELRFLINGVNLNFYEDALSSVLTCLFIDTHFNEVKKKTNDYYKGQLHFAAVIEGAKTNKTVDDNIMVRYEIILKNAFNKAFGESKPKSENQPDRVFMLSEMELFKLLAFGVEETLKLRNRSIFSDSYIIEQVTTKLSEKIDLLNQFPNNYE